nr:MAG TPA: hypothetical protein [Bacteriophage sp.]
MNIIIKYRILVNVIIISLILRVSNLLEKMVRVKLLILFMNYGKL